MGWGLNLNDFRYAEAVGARELNRPVNIRRKAKTLQKFGRRSIGSSGVYTVAELPDAHETLVTTNAIDSVVSTENADTQTIAIEGHTIDLSGNLTFVAQQVTLPGDNTAPATLATPLARATRAYVLDGTFASPSTAPTGTVTVYDSSTAGGLSGGEPVNTVATKITITAGQTQSQKAATALSSTDCLFITGLSYMATRQSGAASVDFLVESRQSGGPYRPLGVEVALRTSAQPYTYVPIRPWRIIAPNSDVRIIADASAACEIAAHWQGLLAGVRGT